MMKVFALTSAIILTGIINTQAQIKLPKQVVENSTVNSVIGGSNHSNLSESQIIQGLKEALKVGTNNAVGIVSKTDGYLKNPSIKIPFPPEAKNVEYAVRQVGFDKQANDFIKALNRAAEDAAKSATPIFVQALNEMTFSEAKKILKGNETAATQYMANKTTDNLVKAFKPIVQKSIEKTEVTKYWQTVAQKYNQLPLTQKVNPDLELYVTNMAIEGLFKMIGEEETKIRKDPAARVNDILKNVFGS